jgi:hypothetical protein
MTRIRENNIRTAAHKDAEITKPDKLSSFKHWQAFWEKWDTYSSQIYGAVDIPINYVYRRRRGNTRCQECCVPHR